VTRLFGSWSRTELTLGADAHTAPPLDDAAPPPDPHSPFNSGPRLIAKPCTDKEFLMTLFVHQLAQTLVADGHASGKSLEKERTTARPGSLKS